MHKFRIRIRIRIRICICICIRSRSPVLAGPVMGEKSRIRAARCLSTTQ